MLNKIKKMLGLSSLPDEVTPLYQGAKNEREALVLLKEARRRDESRRKRALDDLDVLSGMEEELLAEGRQEMTESRKLILARRIKEVRWKIQELNSRMENIYSKRLKIYNEHIASLETVMELSSEEIPDKSTMEEVAIKAKTMVEDLEKTRELAEGISTTFEGVQPDAEEQEILKELEARADLEIEKAEPDIEKEEKAPEKPPEERPDEEPPEIIYEE